jgi:thioredoxin 1
MQRIEANEQFHAAVTTSARTLVQFSASWCKPCQQIIPFVEQLQVPTLYVDVDLCPDLADHYQIGSLPTFLCLDHQGTVHYLLKGANPTQLQDMTHRFFSAEHQTHGNQRLVQPP